VKVQGTHVNWVIAGALEFVYWHVGRCTHRL